MLCVYDDHVSSYIYLICTYVCMFVDYSQLNPWNWTKPSGEGHCVGAGDGFGPDKLGYPQGGGIWGGGGGGGSQSLLTDWAESCTLTGHSPTE